jgi:hypothetical protein
VDNGAPVPVRMAPLIFFAALIVFPMACALCLTRPAHAPP